jgi:hypothetical protein
MSQIREAVSANEMAPETGENVKISGNIPPAFLAARQAMQEESPENSGTQRGPRQRETAPGDAVARKGGGNAKLEELIRGVSLASKANYDKIVLPSRGKFYDGTDGPTDGVLHIRSMTGEEEEILATPRFVKRGQAINMIFNKCIQEKFNSAKFLTADRTYLLVYLRGISYSTQYEVKVRCPNCEKSFFTEINLDHMYVNSCPDDFSLANLEDTLPESKYRFKYRLATGEDEEQVQNYRERRMRFETNGQADDTLSYRTALMIEDIEGLTEKSDIQKLLRKLPINDLAYLRTVVNEPPFGLETNVEIPCQSCMQDFEIDLPLEANFFFPRARKKTQTQA